MTSTQLDVASLSDHAGVLTRNWFLPVIGAIVGAALTLALSLAQPTLYEAEAVMVVSLPLAAEQSGRPMDRQEVATQAELVASDAVAQLVIDDVGLDISAQSLLDNIETKVETDSRVVRVSVLRPTPASAAQVANSFVQQYLQRQAKSDREQQDPNVDLYNRQLADVASEISFLEARLPSLGREDSAAARRTIAVLTTVEDQLEALVSVAETRSDSGGGQVLRVATPPDGPVQPRPLLDSLLGAFVGLVLGILLCYPFDNSRRRRRH